MKRMSLIQKIISYIMVLLLAGGILFLLFGLPRTYSLLICLAAVAFGVCAIILQTKMNRRFRVYREQMQFNEDRYRTLFDQLTDIIYEWNLQTGDFLISRKWFEVFGETPTNDILLDPVHKARYLHPDDREAFVVHTKELFAGGHPKGIVVRLKNKSGQYLWYKVGSVMLRDLSGEPEKLIGSLIDVSDEHDEKQQLVSEAQHIDPSFQGSGITAA